MLGFKEKKSAILEQRNSILKLLLIINIPNLLLLFLFNNIVPEPYMDEEFHYQQFQAYYQNRFAEWHPKITTPPGLYWLQRILSSFLGGSLGTMRCINCLVFSNLFVVFIMKIYDFQDPCPNNLSRSLNLALTPTIFFFNFLDYTDTASIALVAIMYYYNLIKSEWRLSVVSLLAIFVRQNNVIWIGYLIVHRVLGENRKQINVPKSFLGHIFTVVKIFFNHKFQIISQFKLQILAGIIFGVYMCYFNGGRLVFGDEAHHQVTFHPNQLLYLSVFCYLNVPITLGEYTSSTNYILQRMFLSRHSLSSYLFLLSLSIVLVDKLTYVHKFILADNRHYTFYLYSYIFSHASLRYLACILYPFCFIFLFRIVVTSGLKMLRFILWLASSFAFLGFGGLV